MTTAEHDVVNVLGKRAKAQVDGGRKRVCDGDLVFERIYVSGKSVYSAYSTPYYHRVRARNRILDSQLPRNAPLLRQLGITHILNMADGQAYKINASVHKVWNAADVIYKGVAANDNVAYDLSVHFDECTAWMRDVLLFKSGNVLVHCVMGRSRSTTIVAAYLMRYHHLTAAQAVKHLRSRREETRPNTAFIDQLLAYEKSIARR